MLLKFFIQDCHLELHGDHGHVILTFGLDLAHVRERTQCVLHADGGIELHFMGTCSRV